MRRKRNAVLLFVISVAIISCNVPLLKNKLFYCEIIESPHVQEFSSKCSVIEPIVSYVNVFSSPYNNENNLCFVALTLTCNEEKCVFWRVPNKKEFDFDPGFSFYMAYIYTIDANNIELLKHEESFMLESAIALNVFCTQFPDTNEIKLVEIHPVEGGISLKRIRSGKESLLSKYEVVSQKDTFYVGMLRGFDHTPRGFFYVSFMIWHKSSELGFIQDTLEVQSKMYSDADAIFVEVCHDLR